MPASVGFVNIVSVGTGSVINIGDTYTIAPRSEAKTFAGAGSFNTGTGVTVYNNKSISNVNDSDQFDQNIAGTF